MKKTKTITAEEIENNYAKSIADLKAKHKQEFAEMRQNKIEETLQIIEEMYKKFNWRGTTPFTQLRSFGSHLFGRLESCEIVHLTNEGFKFSGNNGSKEIPLRNLPTPSIGLLIAIIKYMQNHK